MEEQKLKNKVFSGVIWKFLERICAQGISLVVSILLARLLMPDDYSVVSIVAIFFSFCNVFISGGLNTSLIHKKNADILDFSTILHIGMIMAAVLYAIMFFAAPAIARLYDKAILVPIIRVMGLGFFINTFKGVVCAQVSNNMEFRKFFWATIVGTVVSAVIGITMALKGYGPWALVAQQMSNAVIDTIVLFFTIKFRFVFQISFKRFKALFRYSWKLFLASIVSTAYDEAKPLIVGLKFSSVDLAFYTKGSSFPSLINSTVSNTMSGVLFPALSKLQDDTNALLSAVRRYIKVSSFLIFPMMMGLFCVSDTFVKVILTEKWLEIVPFLQIFCVCYMFDLVQVGNLQVFKAMGRTDITLITEIIKKSVYFLIILGFVLLSDNAIAFAFSNVFCTVVAILVNTYPNRKLLGYQYRLQLYDIVPNLVAALVMGACVYLVGLLPIRPVLLLGLQVVVGIAVYVTLAILTKNESFMYLLGFVKDLLKKRGTHHA